MSFLGGGEGGGFLGCKRKDFIKVTKPTKSYFDSEMTNKVFILHALDKDKSF